MTFLLDTNVVSELRKAKTNKINPNVKAWAESVATMDLFLSAITVLELEMGIGLLERRDKPQAALLNTWLEYHVLPTFAERILPVDTAVALCCGRLHVPDPRAERDALIAATALIHHKIVVTRNVDDFKPMNVKLLNPWEYTGF
jgi:predicted nucleic acid-binding protein